MADQEQQDQPKRQSRSAKSDKKGPGGLAAIQGEQAPDERPPEEQPGTPEHLGSERPYEGEPSPHVEGDADARNR